MSENWRWSQSPCGLYACAPGAENSGREAEPSRGGGSARTLAPEPFDQLHHRWLNSAGVRASTRSMANPLSRAFVLAPWIAHVFADTTIYILVAAMVLHAS